MMAKWADGLQPKSESKMKESVKQTSNGLYKKTGKVIGFNADELSSEELQQLQQIKENHSETRIKNE